MGKMRKDIRNDKMGVHIKLDEALGKVDNGAFVALGVRVDNDEGRELREGKALEADSIEIAIVCHDEHRYDALDDGQDVVMEAGAIVRGYKLHPQQVFIVEMARLNGECVKGDYLAPVAGGVKLGKAGEGAKVVALVAEVELDAEGNKFAVIEFI